MHLPRWTSVTLSCLRDAVRSPHLRALLLGLLTTMVAAGLGDDFNAQLLMAPVIALVPVELAWIQRRNSKVAPQLIARILLATVVAALFVLSLPRFGFYPRLVEQAVAVAAFGLGLFCRTLVRSGAAAFVTSLAAILFLHPLLQRISWVFTTGPGGFIVFSAILWTAAGLITLALVLSPWARTALRVSRVAAALAVVLVAIVAHLEMTAVLLRQAMQLGGPVRFMSLYRLPGLSLFNAWATYNGFGHELIIDPERRTCHDLGLSTFPEHPTRNGLLFFSSLSGVDVLETSAFLVWSDPPDSPKNLGTPLDEPAPVQVGVSGQSRLIPMLKDEHDLQPHLSIRPVSKKQVFAPGAGCGNCTGWSARYKVRPNPSYAEYDASTYRLVLFPQGSERIWILEKGEVVRSIEATAVNLTGHWIDHSRLFLSIADGTYLVIDLGDFTQKVLSPRGRVIGSTSEELLSLELTSGLFRTSIDTGTSERILSLDQLGPGPEHLQLFVDRSNRKLAWPKMRPNPAYDPRMRSTSEKQWLPDSILFVDLASSALSVAPAEEDWIASGFSIDGSGFLVSTDQRSTIVRVDGSTQSLERAVHGETPYLRWRSSPSGHKAGRADPDKGVFISTVDGVRNFPLLSYSLDWIDEERLLVGTSAGAVIMDDQGRILDRLCDFNRLRD